MSQIGQKMGEIITFKVLRFSGFGPNNDIFRFRAIWLNFFFGNDDSDETFWERKFDTKLHETTWGNVFKFVKEIKLQELQWKILHNIFPTNILLKRMGISQSEKCDYCGENDLIEHYFYLCERNRNLWTKVNQKIRNKLGNEIQLNIKVVLFGIEQDEIYDKLQASEVQFINNMLLIGKFSIIKSKTQNVNLSLLFDNELRIRSKDSNVN